MPLRYYPTQATENVQELSIKLNERPTHRSVWAALICLRGFDRISGSFITLPPPGEGVIAVWISPLLRFFRPLVKVCNPKQRRFSALVCRRSSVRPIFTRGPFTAPARMLTSKFTLFSAFPMSARTHVIIGSDPVLTGTTAVRARAGIILQRATTHRLFAFNRLGLNLPIFLEHVFKLGF